MRTATLTFHASHNYGSMLQAYALQQVMTEVFGYNEIINFRSSRQKRMMRVITMRPAIGPILKDLTRLVFYKPLKAKYRLFERFLNEKLKLSNKEIATVTPDDLNGFGLVCCGSDQIWNPCPEDFDLAYLLPFEFNGKKISYAASMGPGKDDWPAEINKFPVLLKDFDRISVRELGTAKIVERLSARGDVAVNCDPVFLLDKKKWRSIIAEEPIVKGGYIFVYTLFATPLLIDCGKALSKKYGLPVIISNYTNIYDLFSPFEKHLKSGPLEFLNLMYNARMVVTSSFHGTAFSIILNKPFISVNGLSDNRISNLLRFTGLESRSASSVSEAASIAPDLDFCKANVAISEERLRAFEYLESCR